MSHSNVEDLESDGEREDVPFDFSKISDPESDDDGDFEQESNEDNGAETRHNYYQFMEDHDDEGEEKDDEADLVQEPSHKGSLRFFFLSLPKVPVKSESLPFWFFLFRFLFACVSK